MNKKRKRKIKIGRILEFFCIGLVMGIIEDMIAVRTITGTMITWHIIGIIAIFIIVIMIN